MGKTLLRYAQPYGGHDGDTYHVQRTKALPSAFKLLCGHSVSYTHLKGLDQRLAEFLFAEAERTGSDTIRMTHEQIAQHISSAREAVARMLKSFSEDGLVELKRGAITLRDKNRLNRLK